MRDSTSIPNNWCVDPFTQLIERCSNRNKVQKTFYKDKGMFPIVDQGQEFVAGYTDDSSQLYSEKLPVIIFGDHTRIIKYVDFQFATGADGVQLIRPKGSKLDSKFFYYALCNIPIRNEGYARHYKLLKETNIVYPSSLEEQKKIAAILSSVDNTIQATQAVIDQTRRVKQGLLQQLLTRGIGHTRFKQTEIGEIPESWNIQKLRFLLSEPIKNGYSPICPKDPTGNWILNLSAVSPNGLNVKAVKPAPKNDSKISDFLLHSGDFLVSRSNTRERVGFSIMYRGEIENCSYPDLIMRFRIDNRYILDEFLENYLTSSFALGFLQRAAAGTSASMVKINKKILESLPVLMPPIEEQRKISTHIQTTQNTLKHLQDELITFSDIKRGLMQDLLTGRVRVKPDEVNTT